MMYIIFAVNDVEILGFWNTIESLQNITLPVNMVPRSPNEQFQQNFTNYTYIIGKNLAYQVWCPSRPCQEKEQTRLQKMKQYIQRYRGHIYSTTDRTFL